MFSQMVLKMASLSKFLEAILTLVGFLASVFPHVNFQVTSKCEHFLANRAFVFFDPYKMKTISVIFSNLETCLIEAYLEQYHD